MWLFIHAVLVKVVSGDAYILVGLDHYNDSIMGVMASHITSLPIVYLTLLFRSRSKETSKLRVTGLCAGNSPGTGEFPAHMASNAENVSIWWRHHVVVCRLSGVKSLIEPIMTYCQLQQTASKLKSTRKIVLKMKMSSTIIVIISPENNHSFLLGKVCNALQKICPVTFYLMKTIKSYHKDNWMLFPAHIALLDFLVRTSYRPLFKPMASYCFNT